MKAATSFKREIEINRPLSFCRYIHIAPAKKNEAELSNRHRA